MNYYLQTQSPSGNWVDSLGTNDLKDAISHGEYLKAKGETVRVIERKDTPVYLFEDEPAIVETSVKLNIEPLAEGCRDVARGLHISKYASLANLIDTTPDLLAVVKLVCESGLVPEWSGLGKAARAAYAKAKGQVPAVDLLAELGGLVNKWEAACALAIKAKGE